MNTEQVEQIFVEDIIPNRFQPRLSFNDKDLQNLADSIKNYGIIQPLILRKVGNKYEIIAGERRYKASRIAGLKKVPAIIRNLNDDESAEIALIENLQRKNLTSIEEAQSYKYLLDKESIDERKLSNILGIGLDTIENKLKLLKLSDAVQNALLDNKISERHARSLLRLENIEEQRNMLNRTINERLTVKQLDREIDILKNIPTNDNDIEKEKGLDDMDNDINNQNINADQAKNDDKPKTNIFGFQVPSEDELEKEAPNLETENKDDSIEQIGFNPFAFSGNNANAEPSEENKEENVPEETEENFELFDIFGDSISNTDQKKDEKTEDVIDFAGELNKVRDIIKKIKEDGFNVEMEEYDLEDIYQINIKIEKESIK